MSNTKRTPRKKSGETKTCPICGASFYVFPSQKGKLVTCSSACKGIRFQGSKRPRSFEWAANISKAKKGKPIFKNRKTPIVHTCEFCHKEFEVSRRRQLRETYKARFCSLNCWYDFIRAVPENHPSYKGGYLPYYGPNWNQQRRLALKRDGYHCRSCGRKTRSVRLNVHHIIPFREFKGDWQKANLLGNLITLCSSCHAKVQGNNVEFPLPLF